MATVQPFYFDDTTTKQGICQDIDFLCKTDSVKFPKLDKVRLVNFGLDEVANLVQSVSGDWNWEDSGQTDLPIATTDIEDGQADYTIDTSFLSIIGVYIKDAVSGLFTEIKPIDRKLIIENDTSVESTPSNYYISGNSIFLYPIPSADITSGLKVHFQRNIKYFATDATTALAGYNPQFYKLASLYACRDFSIANGKTNLNVILLRIEKMEKALKESYKIKNRTVNTSIKTSLNTNDYK